MCVILSEQGEPSSTRLTVVNVQMNEIPHQLLLYTNDMTLDEKESARSGFFSELIGQFMPGPGSGSLYNDVFARYGENGHAALAPGNQGAVMIVAIPYDKRHWQDTIGLVDISRPNMKSFRNGVKDLCASLKPVSKSKYLSFGLDTNCRGNSAQKIVHRVGNYDISVALNLEELNHSIKWDHFQKPADFATRYATLKDSQLFPFPCAYIVAQAVNSVKDDGFGVIYPTPCQKTAYPYRCDQQIAHLPNPLVYFPTCHEETNRSAPVGSLLFDNGSSRRRNQSYDVELCLFAQGPVKIGETFQKPTYFSKEGDQGRIRALLRLLDGDCVLSETGNKAQYTVQLANNKTVSYSPVQTMDENKNVLMAASCLLY